mmetsp:Transcript_5232/g.16800  ORF Transcript_5232/g.16800 Transcript_5232/m.16800 type:complete len:218 (+) Transcript_5232:1138-1791(+)
MKRSTKLFRGLLNINMTSACDLNVSKLRGRHEPGWGMARLSADLAWNSLTPGTSDKLAARITVSRHGISAAKLGSAAASRSSILSLSATTRTRVRFKLWRVSGRKCRRSSTTAGYLLRSWPACIVWLSVTVFSSGTPASQSATQQVVSVCAFAWASWLRLAAFCDSNGASAAATRAELLARPSRRSANQTLSMPLAAFRSARRRTRACAPGVDSGAC